MRPEPTYVRYLTVTLVVVALLAALVLVAVSVRPPERYLDLLTSTTTA
jgi:phage shock protein PspC (stress-responsive transcriptional regulator)